MNQKIQGRRVAPLSVLRRALLGGVARAPLAVGAGLIEPPQGALKGEQLPIGAAAALMRAMASRGGYLRRAG